MLNTSKNKIRPAKFLVKKMGIKNLSVYQLTLILFITSAIISISFITTAWIFSEKMEVSNEIKSLQEKKLIEQTEDLKNVVTQLIGYIDFVKRDSLHHTLEQTKEKALVYFESLRLQNDGYVFVNTYDGMALLFDGEVLKEPRDISDLTISDGRNLFKTELDLVRLTEGGSFQYLFKKIDDTGLYPKISYVMGFEEWGWIIGAGAYLDTAVSEIQNLEESLNNDLKRNLKLLFIIVLILLIIMLIISSSIAKSIQRQFNIFVINIKKTPLNENEENLFRDIFIRDLKTIGLEILNSEDHARQFGDIVEQSKNEIYVFGVDDLFFVHANKGALQNSGYSLTEILNLTPLDLKTEFTKDKFISLLEPLKHKHTDQIRFETFHKRKGNTNYPVEVHLARSVFNQKDVFVAFIYDISLRKDSERKLILSEKRFEDLFDNAPVSLWEEDFTKMFRYLNQQTEKYKLSAEDLFEIHPEVLQDCADLVEITNVNKQTLQLYEAESKNDLLGNLTKTFTPDSFLTFRNSVLSLHNGCEDFTIEGKNISLKGKELQIMFRWSLQSDLDQSTKKVILSVIDISGLRKTETELKASESRFRAIFENRHTVMLLIDPEKGLIVDANPAATKFYGYTHKQLAGGMNVIDLSTLSDDVFVDKLKDAGTKKRITYNVKHRLSNGEIRDVEIHSGQILTEQKPLIFSIVHDVTEKEKTRNKLEISLNKLESIFRAAPTGIGAVSNRVITEVNQKFCEMLAYEEHELIGKESSILYASRDEFERVGKEKYGQISEKGTGTVETKMICKGGEIIDVLLSSTPIDPNDLTVGVTFTALDITQNKIDYKELEEHRKHLEEIVKERTKALEVNQDALLNVVDDLNIQSAKLEAANNQLLELNEELETFTYSVSHDLKAPLRGIDGYSNLLMSHLGEELDDEAHLFLQNIRQSTGQMNLLIEDLLSYSRMERRQFQFESIKLLVLIKSLLSHFSESIKKNNVTIDLSVNENIFLKADRDGINLILRNLIDNAIKFSSQNKKARIEISCSENDTEWLIVIKDNGIGFDMKYHDRIFKIFQRLHLKEEYDGTGIGLAMVYKAAQRMNAKLWAESEINKGASFYLQLNKFI